MTIARSLLVTLSFAATFARLVVVVGIVDDFVVVVVVVVESHDDERLLYRAADHVGVHND